MPNLNYESGNWTITSFENDSTKALKTFTDVPSISVYNDYSLMNGQTATDCKFMNTSGAGVVATDELIFGAQDISNIYEASRLKCQKADQIGAVAGKRIRVRLDALVNASNSVTGEEKLIPLSGWMVFDIPKIPIINGDAITWLRNRLIGATLPNTGVGPDRLVNMVRGDIDPR